MPYISKLADLRSGLDIRRKEIVYNSIHLLNTHACQTLVYLIFTVNLYIDGIISCSHIGELLFRKVKHTEDTHSTPDNVGRDKAEAQVSIQPIFKWLDFVGN